jgi:hypothetical protein
VFNWQRLYSWEAFYCLYGFPDNAGAGGPDVGYDFTIYVVFGLYGVLAAADGWFSNQMPHLFRNANEDVAAGWPMYVHLTTGTRDIAYAEFLRRELPVLTFRRCNHLWAPSHTCGGPIKMVPSVHL